MESNAKLTTKAGVEYFSYSLPFMKQDSMVTKSARQKMTPGNIRKS